MSRDESQDFAFNEGDALLPPLNKDFLFAEAKETAFRAQTREQFEKLERFSESEMRTAHRESGDLQIASEPAVYGRDVDRYPNKDEVAHALLRKVTPAVIINPEPRTHGNVEAHAQIEEMLNENDQKNASNLAPTTKTNEEIIDALSVKLSEEELALRAQEEYRDVADLKKMAETMETIALIKNRINVLSKKQVLTKENTTS